jgi:hypothetical protein
MTHTPESLLSAVGVDWQARPDLSEWKYGLPTKLGYTGPALDTPELDALLWVEGQRWLVKQPHTTKREVVKCLAYDSFVENEGGWVSGRLGLLFQEEHPGHALAAAIAEVRNG